MMFNEMLHMVAVSLRDSEWHSILGSIKTTCCPLPSDLIHIIATKKTDKEDKSKNFWAEIRKWIQITENTGSDALSVC